MKQGQNEIRAEHRRGGAPDDDPRDVDPRHDPGVRSVPESSGPLVEAAGDRELRHDLAEDHGNEQLSGGGDDEPIDGGPAVVSAWVNMESTPTIGDRYKNPSAKFDHMPILRSNFSS
jgi:hypothetical protein